MNNKRAFIWVLSIFLIIITIFLYLEGSYYWYNYLVFGTLFLFDNLSHIRKNKTTLDMLLHKKYKKFTMLFIYLFILGVLIEGIGHFWLNLWYYPFINPVSEHIISNIAGFLTYPIILMSFREIYQFINSFLKSSLFSIILSMVLGIIVWEIPNLFSKDWVYKIPYINLEIFGINLVVIFGWSILILSPLFIYNLLDIPS